MLDAASKATFHALAGSRTLKRLASRYGMAHERSFARRFIAGETVDEVIHPRPRRNGEEPVSGGAHTACGSRGVTRSCEFA